MIVIGSDHAGENLKRKIKEYLNENNLEYADINNYDENDDYPDIASKLSNKVLENKDNLGIAICGSGIGMCITCNKFSGIRAALCVDEYMAKMCRMHNDANVICLGERLDYYNDGKVYEIIENFMKTSFEGGRHERRLEKISKIENSNKGDNI